MDSEELSDLTEELKEDLFEYFVLGDLSSYQRDEEIQETIRYIDQLTAVKQFFQSLVIDNIDQPSPFQIRVYGHFTLDSECTNNVPFYLEQTVTSSRLITSQLRLGSEGKPCYYLSNRDRSNHGLDLVVDLLKEELPSVLDHDIVTSWLIQTGYIIINNWTVHDFNPYWDLKQSSKNYL